MKRFNRVFPIFLSCALLLGTAVGAAAADTGSCTQDAAVYEYEYALSDFTNGEVLALYTDGSCAVLTYDGEDALAEGLAELKTDPSVAFVQPNYAYESSAVSTEDALFAQQWALSNDGSFYMETQKNRYPVFDDPFGTPSAPGEWTFRPFASQSAGTETTAVAGIDINAAEAWEIYDGGSRDVVIALIDTGVDASHEDLTDILWVNEDEIPGNGIDDDGNGYIDDVYGWNFYSDNNEIYVGSEDSHGTHGAGTIAATQDNGVGISGIVQSDHVKIMVLKALGGTDGSGTTASIIQAIRYAEENGAQICNLSLGSELNDPALYQTIASSSMLFVVAAGNDGADTDSTPIYPASYALDNIISVANLSYDGTLHYSSNYGAVSVDLAAPGTYILSTTPENGYSYMTGTSMSAPMVTAAAAMVYSYFDEITLADVKEILLSSVQELDALEGLTVTGGMLDLGAALSYDLDTLSGAVWETPVTGSGSAPEISAQLISRGMQTYLMVSVADADGDLTAAAYASGTLTAADFQGGSAGTAFSLQSGGSALFSVSGAGSLTFYACDSAGNETVKTVTLSAGTQGARGAGTWRRNVWPW
ncbi:MAG: S8 family serine peptidase [Oscillospiraceae bacterium]|nr:S8 family serine peptidase [Oscillospiraceae bacterium]